MCIHNFACVFNRARLHLCVTRQLAVYVVSGKRVTVGTRPEQGDASDRQAWRGEVSERAPGGLSMVLGKT